MLKALFYAEEESELNYLKEAGCQFAAFTARSPNKDTANEDCAGWIQVDENRWVFIVADGLGGLPAGENASQLAVSVILDRLNTLEESEDLRTAILSGIDQANRAILDTGSGGATTLALVEFDGATARPYHVGDTTILVTGQRGRIKFQSVSHSPTGYMEEAGLIDEREAMLHDERHLVYNVVGSDTMRLDIGPMIPLGKFDTIVIASDGLSDNLTQNQVVEITRSGKLDERTGKLARLCHEVMTQSKSKPAKPDDLTILTLRKG